MEQRKVIIIGSGPAGYTAAIYAARANLCPLILEGDNPGGQLTMTTLVENFPGFPKGIDGPELMNNMKLQAQSFNADFKALSVTQSDFSKRPFQLTCSSGEIFSAESVIISTGASARFLGLPNEKELVGRGLSTCATCDGFFFKNKIIHIVGGGDTAMEEAIFLTKFASKVYVIHRRDSLRASKPMQQRALNNDKIEFLWNSQVSEILFNEQGVTGIKVENTISKDITQRETDGLFYAIGHDPNTNFTKGQISLDDHGFVKTQEGTSTNIPGVFACGDVQDPNFRQAITAAATGCMAAIAGRGWCQIP